MKFECKIGHTFRRFKADSFTEAAIIFALEVHDMFPSAPCAPINLISALENYRGVVYRGDCWIKRIPSGIDEHEEYLNCLDRDDYE